MFMKANKLRQSHGTQQSHTHKQIHRDYCLFVSTLHSRHKLLPVLHRATEQAISQLDADILRVNSGEEKKRETKKETKAEREIVKREKAG